MIRHDDTGDEVEEELYINDQTVVWSKTSSLGTSCVVKSYTLDSAVQDVRFYFISAIYVFT